MLIVFRLPLGVSVGTASFGSPLFIPESAPPRISGVLVPFNQLAMTTGILLAFVVDTELQSMSDADIKGGSSRVRDLESKAIRRLLLVGLGLAFVQQFVGANTVIYYTPTILPDAGRTSSSSVARMGSP